MKGECRRGRRVRGTEAKNLVPETPVCPAEGFPSTSSPLEDAGSATATRRYLPRSEFRGVHFRVFQRWPARWRTLGGTVRPGSSGIRCCWQRSRRGIPPATWKRGRNNGRSEVRRGCSRSGHCWPTCSLEQTRLIDLVGTHGNADRTPLSPSTSSPSLYFSHFYSACLCFVPLYASNLPLQRLRPASSVSYSPIGPLRHRFLREIVTQGSTDGVTKRYQVSPSTAKYHGVSPIPLATFDPPETKESSG